MRQNKGKCKRPGVEPRHLWLSHQCSATEPWQPVLSWWWEFSGKSIMEFWQHMLSGCQVCDWGIQYHLCSTYRGLWGLVVVCLSWLSGRALVTMWRIGQCCFGFPTVYRSIETRKYRVCCAGLCHHKLMSVTSYTCGASLVNIEKHSKTAYFQLW